ncbi:MAG: dihydroorotate dehydrogenase [Gemmatimonadetes bacterium]|uniref:Dihydroorotate dehydrogenase n=1 Tax=Candidatus Kutchimonas denitrificans TaxID=3056748 RepID=A0AAE4ZBQ7_9BACT|nr:dihydroorotate dehydrogenase [Gemmatimonadota bacterium]NIR75356.1 dihydroorotate dehydrogenase [Candidatus Kutchimonas denitrificans]NIS00998.1 dihydroorotate dehydrogenase [Gemmatimonadota bacterium]NIT66622.1 dihydroorotate dehydrogenase [Gemmatimonadota bacterium]NIU53202.1 dihydroorotate dehydrogenase [Gemmatimonadota bacterium]
MVDLSQELFGTTFQNPVLLASGTCGYGEEYSDLIAVDELGGIVTKAVTPERRLGNPPTRISETPAGMINAIGLANVGLDGFKREKLPWIREHLSRAKVLVNVAGRSVEDFVGVVEGLEDEDGFLGYEINVSCPNVEGGTMFGTDELSLAQLVAALRRATRRPLVVKLTPNVAEIGNFARICEENGADGLSTINTFPGMLIDVETRRPVIGNVTGGISGPAIKPMGVFATWKATSRVEIPIIGIGGICNARDALEYILAGASLVQIGTAMFADPFTAPDTIRGLREICERQGVTRAADLVGALEVR